ncbi:hypothetical protein GDO81_011596, partial [Engystomops pustulosus]
ILYSISSTNGKISCPLQICEELHFPSCLAAGRACAWPPCPLIAWSGRVCTQRGARCQPVDLLPSCQLQPLNESRCRFDVIMHLLRTLYLRCNSSIIAVSTLRLRACRQRCLISPRVGCQALMFHGQNQWFHSAPRHDSSQDKGEPRSPSPATSNPVQSKETAAPVTATDDTVDETDPLQDKSIGLVQRFKKTFKQYGKVMVTVHVLTSSVWLGTFYYGAVK